MDADALRRLALVLPEVEEYERGGLPAFRVRGKRFATMLDEDGFAAVITLVLTTFAPPGVPVIVGSSAALLGLRRA